MSTTAIVVGTACTLFSIKIVKEQHRPSVIVACTKTLTGDNCGALRGEILDQRDEVVGINGLVQDRAGGEVRGFDLL